MAILDCYGLRPLLLLVSINGLLAVEASPGREREQEDAERRLSGAVLPLAWSRGSCKEERHEIVVAGVTGGQGSNK